jgi:HEAT repeat protein
MPFVLISPAFTYADSLGDLRQTLKAPVDNLEAREHALRACGRELETLKELTHALFLREWRDNDLEPNLAAADRRAWLGISERLVSAIRTGLNGKEFAGKVEAIEAITEAGNLARSTGRRFEFVQSFVPDLIRLLKDPEPGIVRHAARALACVRPDPQDAVTTYRAALLSEDSERRLAAAEGLAQLMHNAAELARQEQYATRAEALRAEAGIIGSLIVPVATLGLIDDNTEVRLWSLHAILQSARAVNVLVRNPSPADEKTPDSRREVEAEQTALRPLVLTLQAHAQSVGRSLQDFDPEIRQTALHVLEEVSHARRHLLDRAASVQSPAPTKLAGEKTPGDGIPIKALAGLLLQKDMRVRLAALDILEALGPCAAPAAPVVVKELADKNRFVRWAAARALAKIGPADAEHAVPALTHLLSDADSDLQTSAADALATYGPAARPAVLPLTAALASESPALRVAALHALDGIGPDAELALAAIRDALEDRDTHVRQSAARLLGKFGPSARDALNSLRSRLDDSNPAVRTAAQEAMRRIAEPKKEN